MNANKLAILLATIAILLVSIAVVAMLWWSCCGGGDPPTPSVEDVVDEQKRPDPPTPPVKHLVKKVDLPAPPPDKRPEPIAKQSLLDFYPQGKQVHSVGYLNVTGRGTNKSWAIHHESTFAYQYRLHVDGIVKKNQGSTVTFEVQVLEAVQLTAVTSERAVQLNEQTVGTVARATSWLEPLLHAEIRTLKKAAELINRADPRLKKTLTAFMGMFKFEDPAAVSLRGELDKISGMRFEIEYVSGLGCTRIHILKGQKLPADVLEQLALQVSLMADYFVSRGAALPVGSTSSLNIRDVGGLVGFGQFADLTGNIEVKRVADDLSTGQALQLLEVLGGTVEVRGRGEDRDQHATVRPQGGKILYSERDHCVRHAQIDWDGNIQSVSQGSLLFTWQNVHSAQMRSIYDAELANSKAPSDGR